LLLDHPTTSPFFLVATEEAQQVSRAVVGHIVYDIRDRGFPEVSLGLTRLIATGAGLASHISLTLVAPYQMTA
jgi:hypothetical protein